MAQGRVEMIKSFTLLGKKFTVHANDKLEEQGCLGRLQFDNGIVMLRPQAFKKRMDQRDEHAFLHEVVHAILISMGENKLSKDERFVDVFSGLLQQFFNTKE